MGNFVNIIHSKKMKIIALLLFPFLIISAATLLITNSKDEIKPASSPKEYFDTVKNQDNKTMDIFSPITKFNNLKENYTNLHFDAVTLDAHNDFLYQAYNKGADLGKRNKGTQSDIPKFNEGGLKIQIFSLWIPTNEMNRSYQFVVESIKMLKGFEKEYADKFEIAYHYDDIRRIVLGKKFCGLMGIEGGTAIGEDIDKIKAFFDLGVRYISLTWNNSNSIGVSAADEYKHNKKGGLTKFGFEVIKKMDEVGMLIDVSHFGQKGFWDVINTSKNPIIASHSDCYTLCPHYRNLTDDQIKAIAKTGGVVMINFHNDFTSKDAKGKTRTLYDIYSTQLDEISELYRDDPVKCFVEKQNFLKGKEVIGSVSADVILDHIEYVKNLVGADYVGIGSDMDGGIGTPYDLYDVTCYPLLTQKMVERGYTEPDIRKILGLNFLRVFKLVCG